MYQENKPKVCRGFVSSSIQHSINQHRHARKLPEARKESSEKIRMAFGAHIGPGMAHIPISHTGKPHKSQGMGLLRRPLPQSWGIISPSKHYSGPT